MNWDQNKCAVCGKKTTLDCNGHSIRSIQTDCGQLNILGAPLCKKCFPYVCMEDPEDSDYRAGYKSMLHPDSLIVWSQVCIEAHLIICGGFKIPGETDSHKNCTRCNFPYPYESGPAICKSCQVWEYVS